MTIPGVDARKRLSSMVVRFVTVLLIALPNVSSGAESAAGTPMSTAEMARKATEQSADKHRIEILPGGRARVPAPLQAMEATAAPEGINVVSTEKSEPGTFAIRAASLGRAGDKLVPLLPGKVSVDGQLARITRPGLVEELTTSADGVRQDFVVTAAPAGKGDLVLELEVSGALAELSKDSVKLTLESGRELLYHRLLVTDGKGKQLPARFELSGSEQLRIIVADAGAAYPVRIDPTITDADWVSIAAPDTNNPVYALQVAGTSLYAAGRFTAIGGIATNRIAEWNGSSWSALGSGMDNTVWALAWDGTNLYAGGQFTTAGGTNANAIAKWDGSSWSALGSGVSNIVYALAWGGSNLYVGGTLFTAGGIPVAGIAKWDGNSWSALGAGIYGYLNALAWDGTSLYAGGEFTIAGMTSANRIAKWDGSSWSALGTGMNSSVSALVWDGSYLYAGGYFTTAGGGAANRIAKWNGSSWTALGTGMNNSVRALVWDGTNLYAGGEFTTAGGASANAIAKWNGSSWSALGSGIGSYSMVYALAWDGTNLNAGGEFRSTVSASASYIAKWNGSIWSAMGGGMNGNVSALAWDGTNLYAGGSFNTAGGINANAIAKWNGSSWSALGSGMSYGYVNALVWGGTNLYAGGDFAIAGGGSADGIAKWNGSSWSALGSGMDNSVLALAWDGTNLYAGGWFTSAGGTSANRIAKWNGSSWSALGSGMDSYHVSALAWDGTNLYAGGQFTTAGGTSASSIAKWNGSSWSALGSGMNGKVSVLACDGTNLYAGGEFTTAGGTSANSIAKWNGGSWSALGSGMNNYGYVNALAWDGTNLYAGGSFTTAGGASANRIAKWNGSSWSPLGSGMDASVYALALGGTNLYAGGPFNIAGGKSARAVYAKLGRTLTATAGANGSISSNNPLTVIADSTVSFTLAPAATYQPSSTVSGTCPTGSWNGNVYTTGAITADCTVGFSFVKITYPLTATFQGGGTGTVTMLPNPPASNCSSTCSQSLEMNTSVQLTAVPDVGSVFTSWSGCDTVAGNVCTATMNQAKSVTVTFSLSGPIDGVCSTSNGRLFTSAPSDSLCAMGNPSEVTGTGPWTWTCPGVNGGENVACATISIDAGLVASYPLNGNADDASGNSNNSMVNGAVLTTDRSDIPDSAYAFDGNSSYLITAHSTSLQFTNAFTFSTWVNFNQINRTTDGFDQQVLFAKKNYSQFGLVLSTEPTGNLVFHHEGLTPNQSSYNWADVQPGTWYHLTVTYDGSKTRHFINGVLKAETTVSGTLTANNDDLYIGKSVFSNPEFPWEYPLDGKLDDIRFYNRAFNAAEVAELYQATYPLSLTINGEGTGSVHSSPTPDISCLAGACAQSYPAGAVVTLTASAASGSAFTGWSGDCSGAGACSVTMDRARSVIATFSRAGDSVAPVITAFVMPASATDLTVPVSTFTATDNIGVTGYLITQDAAAPSATAAVWSATAPASYTFLAPGNCYAYAWVKDAAGNVSSAGIAVVNITISAPSDTVAPLITSFLVPSANTLTPAITAFAVIDNVGVTGYLVSETGTAPLADDPRWTGTAPGSYTFASYGAKTLYSWAKDAAGNISARVAAYPTLLDPAQAIDTLLTGWPGNPATSSPSTFAFTANQAEATFECNMDGQTWYACTSPASFGALANGGHMFSVRAKSSGGSYDSSPVSFIWTVAVPLVQINLSSYTSLSDAYTDSSSGSILKIKGMEFGTMPVFDRPVTITLQGGYDSAFTGASGTSTLHGTLTISAGAITFDRINIQ